MIFRSIAPTRLSLFGGGTDIPTFASRHGGMTINMTVNLYQKIEMMTELDNPHTKDIFPENADPLLFHSILKTYNYDKKTTHLRSYFDGVIGAGLGSSAAGCVALLGAIHTRKNGRFQMQSDQLAEEAWRSEQHVGWYGGKQDQYASVYGGLNMFVFNDKVIRTELSQSLGRELSKYLLLFYTGGQRSSHTIQKEYIYLTEKQIETLIQMKTLTLKAFTNIMEKEWDKVGELFDTAWELKKQSNKKVTSERIDDLYTIAKNTGAIGGKILGAGGCGYMIFFCPKKQDKLITRLEKEDSKHIVCEPDFGGLKIL